MATDAELEEAALYQARVDLLSIDVPAAEGILREAKQIFDQQGIVFHLISGTLLGAIRDNALIPWDDDVDVASVIGLDGLSEESVDETMERVATAFREEGFVTVVERDIHYLALGTRKSSVLLSWCLLRPFGDRIVHYPGVRMPISLFTNLKEINFVGDKFLVPNPPEEFPAYKVRSRVEDPKANWVSERHYAEHTGICLAGPAGPLKQFLTTRVLRSKAARLRVLDHTGEPVVGAEVIVAGLNRSRTNKQGYATFYLPHEYYYALVIRFGDHEEVLYEEMMGPGKTYVYRADPSATARMFALIPE